MIWLSVKSLEEGNHEQGPWVTGTAEASQFAKAEEEPVFALGFDAASKSKGKRKGPGDTPQNSGNTVTSSVLPSDFARLTGNMLR